MLPRIMLYTRRGCHLCEAAWDALVALGTDTTREMKTCDVDADPTLQLLYGDRVPVVTVDGVVALEGRFDDRDVALAVGRFTGPASVPADPARRPTRPPT